jgi:signal transduction histidine kinase/DNA-binding NarL/FixJ family response regulator
MYRMRLSIIGLCAALVCSQIGLQAYALLKHYEQTIVDAELAQQEWTRGFELYVQRAFASADIVAEQTIARIREGYDVRAVAGDASFAALLRRAAHKTSADHFLLVGAAGQPLLTSNGQVEAFGNLADRSWFLAHSEKGLERYIGPSLLAKRTPDVQFVYTRRLSALDHQFAGVFQIAFRQGFMEGPSLRSNLSRSVQFALWTPQGDRITRTGLKPAGVNEPVVSDPNLPMRVRASSVGVYRDHVDGAGVITAYRALANWPVVVTTSRPLEDVLQPWWREVRYASWRSAAFALFSAFVAGAGLASMRAMERSQAHLAAALKDKESLLDDLSDLSLLRRRDAELSAARTQLRGIIDNMNEGLIVFGANSRLVLWNQRMLDFFPELGPILRVGMFRQEFLERAAHILCLELDKDENITSWVREQVEKFDAARSIEQPLRDGRWLLLRQARGEDGSLIIVRTDITDLKGREADLRKSKEALRTQSCKTNEYAAAAQKASRAKSAFLAAMSHEIRTPLTAVIGFTRLLGDTPLSEEQRAHVNVLRASSHHLLALVGDILDFSKLESGNLALDCEALDLGEIMREVESITRGLLGDRPLDLRVQISPDAPRWIMGDSARIKQVLLNFTSNAVKFTNEGEIALEVALEDKELVFSVRDTGIGVPMADQERIFSAFEQVRGDGPIYRAGAGLGLSISKSLAEAMAGSIGVKSEAGQGSCFWFRMQCVDAPTPLLGRSQIAQAAPTPVMRILVAEDAPSSAKLIEAILTKMNHVVVLAADGAQALEAAQAAEFDLVLMDLQMPVKSGLEAARAIRALGGRWRTIPIFALTAAALQEDQDSAQEAGMDEFLTKPFSPEDLAAALTRAALRNLDAQRTTTHRTNAIAAPSAETAQASTACSPRLRCPAGAP